MDFLLIILIILLIAALAGGATIHNLFWIVAVVLVAWLIFVLVGRNRRV